MGSNIGPTVRNLLIANLLLFFLPYLTNNLSIVTEYFGLYNPYSPKFLPFQFLTHFFLHASPSHILMNMLGLFVFGNLLEQFWGSKRFLYFYLICGFGAGILYTGVNWYEMTVLFNDTQAYLSAPSPDEFVRFFAKHDEQRYQQLLQFANLFQENASNLYAIEQSKELVQSEYLLRLDVPMVGASGAVYGVMMAFALLFPNLEMMLLFPPIPVKAKYLVGIYGITALFSAIHQTPGDNVAHFAHLGGMVIAFILVKMWKNTNRGF